MDRAIKVFYVESFHSQMMESKNLNNEPNQLQLETSRRCLGCALNRMLAACVPESFRHRRLFRSKYRDELNIQTLEDCLISAANKVLNLSLSDRSLSYAQPMATQVLETLARVQTVVSTMVEGSSDIDSNNEQSTSFSQLSNSSISIKKLTIASVENDENLTLQQNNSTEDFGTSPNSLTYPEHSSFSSEIDFSTFYSQDQADVMSLQSLAKSIVCNQINIPTGFTELLIEFDHILALFEFALVGAVSKKLRSKRDVEELYDVVVLFSETIMWAQSIGLIDPTKLADRDPQLLVSLPRLAIFVGCCILPDSPIGPLKLSKSPRPPFMFSTSAKELPYLSRQLSVLRADQLWHLVCWLSPYGLPDDEVHFINSISKRPCKSRKNNLVTTTIDDLNLGQDSPVRKIKPNTLGLHNLYKCISSVAGNFSTKFPTEYRDIVQLSIQLNDSNEAVNSDSEIIERKPISLYDSNFIGNQHSLLEGIDLKQIFDWQAVVSCRSTQLWSDLLFEKCEKNKSQHTPTSPSSLREHKISVQKNTLSSTCLNSNLEEIGVDVVSDFHEITVSENNNNSTGRQPFSWFNLFSRPLEGELTAISNPIFNLPVWQPDFPTFFIDRSLSDHSNSEGSSSSNSESDPRTRVPQIGKECASCGCRFNLIRRRHHCRRCAHIFCRSCCNQYVTVEHLISPTPVRVCTECANFVRNGYAE